MKNDHYDEKLLIAAIGISMVLIITPVGLVAAHAQPTMPAIPSMTEVSGSYTDTSTNLKITFPDGWKGFALPGLNTTTTMVVTSPDDLSSGSQKNSMLVGIITKNNTQQNSIPEKPSNIPNDKNVVCKPTNPESVQINGMSGIVIVSECTSSDSFYKSKMYFFQSDTKLFTVGYTATSAADYNTNVGTFDNSVTKTLTIPNTIAAPAVPEFPLTLVGSIAAVIGVIALLGRTKLMSGKSKSA